MELHNYIAPYINKENTVLDIGCGDKLYSKFSRFTTTIDAWKNTSPDLLLDIEIDKLPFEENTFDYITILDCIEHLTKENGKIVIEQCKKIVKNKLFIFTPLFWTDNEVNVNNPNSWAFGNPYNYHKSLWSVEEDFTDWNTVKTFEWVENEPQWLGYWQK